nr:DUF4862 family protein [Streptomyces sp. S584]
MNTAQPVALVGAYAALPPQRADQEHFYEGLADRGMADGLELPFRDGLGEDVRWLAARMRGRFTRSVITLIPGTMMRVGASGTFGLASGDHDGRQAALAFVREARVAAEELNQLTGEQSVSALHIHTAPSATAVGEMFARSLEELTASAPAEGDWSTRLVLEHCDAYSPAVPGEKRFLSLEEEIPLAHEAGIGITVNWGRSAIEAQDRSRPLAQIIRLASEDLLEGVMFSGAGPTANRYGGPGRTHTCPSPRTSPPPSWRPRRYAAVSVRPGAASPTRGRRSRSPATPRSTRGSRRWVTSCGSCPNVGPPRRPYGVHSPHFVRPVPFFRHTGPRTRRPDAAAGRMITIQDRSLRRPMAAMTALTTLCPPPGPTSNIHWETVEATLGMPLPQDYKELADRYGPGVFNGFVHVYHPHGATEHADLTGPVPGRIRARLSRDREQGTHPVPYDPETLFACAVTDNGEYLFWITDPAGDPDRWRIAVNQARGPDWFTYDGTLTAFLTAALGGRIEVPLFPVSLGEAPAGFAPARPVSRQPGPLPGHRPVDTGTIRSWARARGYDVPPRGRIPLEVREAWERRTQKG